MVYDPLTMCPVDKLTDVSFNETITGFQTLFKNCYFPRMWDSYGYEERDCEISRFTYLPIFLFFGSIIVFLTANFDNYTIFTKSKKWYDMMIDCIYWYFFIPIIYSSFVIIAGIVTFVVTYELFCKV